MDDIMCWYVIGKNTRTLADACETNTGSTLVVDLIHPLLKRYPGRDVSSKHAYGRATGISACRACQHQSKAQGRLLFDIVRPTLCAVILYGVEGVWKCNVTA